MRQLLIIVMSHDICDKCFDLSIPCPASAHPKPEKLNLFYLRKIEQNNRN